MLILAIDPGTNMGAAWTRDGRVYGHQCTVIDLKPSRHEGGGMRYLRVARWIESVAPTEVWYEEVRRHKGTDAAHIYGGIVATIAAWCEERSIPYKSIPVGTVKKHAAGKGNADKAAMIAAARAKLGYVGDDDNEADALWILATVLAHNEAIARHALAVTAADAMGGKDAQQCL